MFSLMQWHLDKSQNYQVLIHKWCGGVTRSTSSCQSLDNFLHVVFCLIRIGNIWECLRFIIRYKHAKTFQRYNIYMNTIYFQSNIQLNLNLRLNIGIVCLFAFLTLGGWGLFGKVFLFLVRWCGDCNLYIS